MEFIVLYLIYNILIGIVATMYCYQREGTFFGSKNFFLILFLPVFGLGRWFYQKEIKSGLNVMFPQEWYVYKYMLKLNKIYLLIGVLSYTICYHIGFEKIFGSSDFMGLGDNAVMIGFGLLMEMSKFLMGMFLMLYLIFAFIFHFFILIRIPENSMKQIERKLS